MMKIVVLTGSPHHPGTSEQLADAFVKGATEAGNEVYRFDAGRRTDEFWRTIIPDKKLRLNRMMLLLMK